MNLLLINPPKEKEVSFAVLKDYNVKARSNQPPLGLMYLYSYLFDKFNVAIEDMNAREEDILDMKKHLDKYKPDIVGITCVISKWETVIELAKQIKEYDESIQVVVGGVNPSLYTYETLQCPHIDYAVRGFGQIPLLNLCKNFKKGLIQNDIKNCFTKENYKTNMPGFFCFEDIDKYPLPDRKILPIEDYNLPYFPENPSTSMVSSFGCPYTCHFCQCRTFKPLIIRDAENVVKEMEEIQDLGIRSIMFQDELFTMSDARIKSICSLILEKGINLHWSVRARAHPLEQESLNLMKRAGCFNIHMGIESGNERILKKMNKRITVAEIKESINRIKKADILCSASFMLGYPTETREEIMETIDFAASSGLSNCQFYITMPATGTLLYEEWKKFSGYEGDISSKFTLNPKEVNIGDIIASDIFNKEEMNEFLNIGFSKTKNLYRVKGRDV